jgi:hypothetical protein
MYYTAVSEVTREREWEEGVEKREGRKEGGRGGREGEGRERGGRKEEGGGGEGKRVRGLWSPPKT